MATKKIKEIECKTAAEAEAAIRAGNTPLLLAVAKVIAATLGAANIPVSIYDLPGAEDR